MCATAASSCRSRRMPDSVTAQFGDADGATAAITAQYLVGCDGGASLVRRQLGIKLQGEPIFCSCARRSIAATISTSASRSARGGIITWPTDNATFLIVQDFDQAFHPAFGGRERRRHGGDVREDRRHAGEIRDALCRAMAAEPAARRPLRRRPRVPRRRCRASGDPDRRARHEYRRRRRDRSRPGSWRRRCRAGAGPTCCRPTRSSAGRSASATWRPRAMRRRAGANGARCGGRTSATIRRRARRRAPTWCASPTSSSARATR